jgi:hypothetical protein
VNGVLACRIWGDIFRIMSYKPVPLHGVFRLIESNSFVWLNASVAHHASLPTKQRWTGKTTSSPGYRGRANLYQILSGARAYKALSPHFNWNINTLGLCNWCFHLRVCSAEQSETIRPRPNVSYVFNLHPVRNEKMKYCNPFRSTKQRISWTRF